MNKDNLIRLGAFAQTVFELKPDFTVMEIPSDFKGRYRVAIRQPVINRFSEFGEPPIFDEVDFEKYGTTRNWEFMRIAYAPRANVLVIQDCR